MYSLNPRTVNSIADAVEFSLKGLTLARVIDVIIDDENSEYAKFGRERSIGCIKYQPIGDDNVEKEKEELPIAYPLYDRERAYPLKNEIVLITKAQSGFLSDRNMVTYYLSAIALFDNINHNSIARDYGSLDLGEDIPEVKINNLQPYPGDYLVQGRLGNSIRLSGYNHKDSVLSDNENNGKPYIVIRNGQFETESTGFIQEDINDDDSSIYITSDHAVPLTQIRTKFNAVKQDPVLASEYKGRQIVIDSGRLYFNAKDEDILFSSQESFGVTSNDISLDAEDYIGLDAKKIYLGEKARVNEKEPVIKGAALESYLKTLNANLRAFADTIIPGKGLAKLQAPLVNGAAKQLKAGVNSLDKITDSLKSRKTFTE